MNRPKIVCLCGSTRFSEAYREANLRETLAGNIVLTIGCDMRTDGELFAAKTPEEREAIKSSLDDLHLQKIDMADEVLILNVGGYVGESTRREIQYAQERGKVIRWLELPDALYNNLIDLQKAAAELLGCYLNEWWDRHEGGLGQEEMDIRKHLVTTNLRQAMERAGWCLKSEDGYTEIRSESLNLRYDNGQLRQARKR